MHKIFFYNKFIIRLYMFRALCAHHQEVKIVLYSFWSSGAQVESHDLYFFDVLLTVHLSIILAINQLNAQNLVL